MFIIIGQSGTHPRCDSPRRLKQLVANATAGEASMPISTSTAAILAWAFTIMPDVILAVSDTFRL